MGLVETTNQNIIEGSVPMPMVNFYNGASLGWDETMDPKSRWVFFKATIDLLGLCWDDTFPASPKVQ